MQELIKKWRRLARSNRRVHKKAIKCGGSDIPALTQAATLEACVKELQELESRNEIWKGWSDERIQRGAMPALQD